MTAIIVYTPNDLRGFDDHTEADQWAREQAVVWNSRAGAPMVYLTHDGRTISYGAPMTSC